MLLHKEGHEREHNRCYKFVNIMHLYLFGMCNCETIFIELGPTFIIKFYRATSRVKWLNGEKSKVSGTISVLVFRVPKWLEFPWELHYPEDEDGDGSRNVGFFAI
jgi:hypothetical protein